MSSLAATHSIPIVLIPLDGTEELAGKIEYYLRETYNKEECHVVNSQIVRFSTGDAKAVLEDTVRGPMCIYWWTWGIIPYPTRCMNRPSPCPRMSIFRI